MPRYTEQDILNLMHRVDINRMARKEGKELSCPVCTRDFVSKDGKQIFCSHDGPGNCKNAYYTAMRGPVGKRVLARVQELPTFNLTEVELLTVSRAARKIVCQGAEVTVAVTYREGKVINLLIEVEDEFGGSVVKAQVLRDMCAHEIEHYINMIEGCVHAK